ncbi:hypothetical protein PanWU01x14_330540 [Parasponia andersonii]|uniref:Root meristem growth factor n=1 Tax=Parasponia andersonii TaxID=3476 RepID=A0A2P5AHZ1_PARAD|nr:hypothetical protein PanWU01x14_330540 [Parasponia andersonii]
MELSIRFSSSIVVLIMLYLRYSSAQTHPGVLDRKVGPVGSTTGVVAPEGSPMSYGKEIYYGVPTSPRHGGSKMKQLKRLLGMVLVKEEGIDGGDNHTNKNNISGEGILNHVERSRRITMSPRRLKAKMADFIAFNADYHVPRPHPPKNN